MLVIEGKTLRICMLHFNSYYYYLNNGCRVPFFFFINGIVTSSFIFFANTKLEIIYFIYVCIQYIITITCEISFLIKFRNKFKIIQEFYMM